MYSDFMSGLIAKGHAEPLPRDVPDNQRVWYLPHHSVTNPKKPEKVRVVFDAAAKYQGTSLNESLMQGPDLTNNLVGVLLRFRLETIAVAADIESMFYEVKVPKQDRDSMRFLWRPNGDLSRDPDEYRMSVHIFGGRSSPSCAGYALQRAGKEQRNLFDPDVITTVEQGFYVDDLLTSRPTVQDAARIGTKVKELLQNRGFNLTKFMSNSKALLETLSEAQCTTKVKGIEKDDTPIDRALGIEWNTDTDCFQFTVCNQSRPITRRGVLSIVSSLFDPLGLVAPVTLPAKRLLQQVCE